MLRRLVEKKPSQARRQCRPRLEQLEDRLAPAQVLNGGTLIQETFDDVNAATFPGTGTFDDSGALPSSAAQVLFHHDFLEGYLGNGGTTVPASGQTAQDFLAVSPDTITLHPFLPAGVSSAQVEQAALDVRIDIDRTIDITFVGQSEKETLYVTPNSPALITGGAGTSLSGTTVNGWTTVAANEDDIVREDANGTFYELGPITEITVSLCEIDNVRALVSLPAMLSSSADPSVPGQRVTFTARVAYPNGSSVPTGSFAFNDGNITLGTAAVDNTGQAEFTTQTPLTVGDHRITAVYSGDQTYAAITTPALIQTVSANLGALAATLHGFAWVDANANGVFDPGEQPIVGATVFVDLNNDGILDQCDPFAVTQADGSYTITGIPPGTHNVINEGDVTPLSSPDPANAQNFGTALAVSGNHILVSDPGALANDPNVSSGMSHRGRVYVLDGKTLQVIRSYEGPPSVPVGPILDNLGLIGLLSGFIQVDELFGLSVATNGAYDVVGAPSAVDIPGPYAYPSNVFVYDSASGQLLSTVYPEITTTESQTPSGTQTIYTVNMDPNLGTSVALNADNVLAVGSPDGGPYGLDLSPSLSPTLRLSLSPLDHGEATATLGPDSSDTFVTGEPDVGGGVASVLQFGPQSVLPDGSIGSNISQLGNLDNPVSGSNDSFGAAIAGIGNDVLVGAPGLTTSAGAVQEGAVYLFDSVAGTLVHTFSDPADRTDDHFGFSLAVVGNEVIIGAPGTNDGQGAVYVFDDVTGQLLQTIVSPASPSDGEFGFSLAVLDQNHIIVGAPFANGTGAAYILPLAPRLTFSADDHQLNFPQTTDLLSNGISQAIENNVPNAPNVGPGTGDGNGDGIPDINEPNVASLPNPVDGGYITIVSQEPGTRLIDVQALPSDQIPNPPPGTSFPFGLLSFTVTGVTPGGDDTVEIIPHSDPTGNTFYKVGRNDPNSPARTTYPFNADPNNPSSMGAEVGFDSFVGLPVIYVNVRDGGTNATGPSGDDDQTANGIIVDPFAAGLVQSPTTVAVAASGPAVYGQAVSVTATVAATLTGSGTPTGSIEFQIDGLDQGPPVALSNGIATLTVSSLAPGLHNITALYISDDRDFADTGNKKDPLQEIIRPAPIVTISASNAGSPPTGVRGQPQNFTFTALEPSSADTLAGFIYTVNWGDGTPTQTIPASAGNGAGVSVGHVFFNAGTYDVQVTATDQDGNSSSVADATINISAVALEPDPFLVGKTMLAVGGTTGNDTINFRPVDSYGDIDMVFDGQFQGALLPTGHIAVFGNGGNDTITLGISPGGRYRINISAFVIADGGKDHLSVVGSNADNVLVADTGTSTLTGGSGRDILIASPQSTFRRGSGDALVIRGVTPYDGDLDSLDALMAEWGRSGTTDRMRLTHLLHGGGLNGDAVLAAAVAQSGAKNTLFAAALEQARPTALAPHGFLPATMTMPKLTWSSVTSADHYLLVVDDLAAGAQVFAGDVAGTSWAPAVPLTAGHEYRWHVQAADATGNLSLVSDAVVFSIAPPTSPKPVSPSGPLPTTTVVPAFYWSAVAGADHYELQVDDLTTGKRGVLQELDALNNAWMFNTALLPGHHYRWRIRAVAAAGTTGPWSSYVLFSILA